MSTDRGQDIPRPELAGSKPVEVFYEVQKAIDAANMDGAISVWRDRGVKDPTNNFYDGSQPAFITFFNPDEASSFALKIDELKKAKDASAAAKTEFDLGGEKDWVIGIPEAIYQDKKWLVDSDKLLSEEQERKTQVVIEGDPHVFARMLRMGKTGFFNAEDMGDVTAHLKACANCSELLRLLPVEDPDALRAELLNQVLAREDNPKEPAAVERRRSLTAKPSPRGLKSGDLK